MSQTKIYMERMQSSSKISKLTHQNAKLMSTTSNPENKNRDRKNTFKLDEQFSLDEDSTSIATLRSNPTIQ